MKLFQKWNSSKFIIFVKSCIFPDFFPAFTINVVSAVYIYKNLRMDSTLVDNRQLQCEELSLLIAMFVGNEFQWIGDEVQIESWKVVIKAFICSIILIEYLNFLILFEKFNSQL